MIKQTEELEFSKDEYTDLVRTFQTFPRRPNLSAVLEDHVYDECGVVVDLVARQAQTPVQKVWFSWAVRVEAIHQDRAQKMRRCKLKRVEQDEGDFGLEHVSLSPNLPKTESLTDLLHKSLDSSSEPDEKPENPETGLETHMQRMGF